MAYENLLAIYQEQRQLIEYYRSNPVPTCPNDGTPLTQSPGRPGIYHCPHDGWEYPRDYIAGVHDGL